jgi:hypothetical protein
MQQNLPHMAAQPGFPPKKPGLFSKVPVFRWLALLLVGLALSQNARAQFSDRTFKPFKIIASMGFIKPKNLSQQYSFGFQMEPKYGLNDNFWVCTRFESALIVQKTLLSEDYMALAIFSILPGLDYSLVVNEHFRPFVGLAAGLYTTRQYYDGSETQGDNPFVSRFGFCPRIGFEYNRFCLSAETNLVRNGQNYTGIKAGFTLGGGTVD